MDFSPKALRARFRELTAEYDKREAKLAPLRKKLDDHVATAAKAEQAIREKIKAASVGLYDLEMERAAVARALGGKTGEPADVA